MIKITAVTHNHRSSEQPMLHTVQYNKKVLHTRTRIYTGPHGQTT